MIIGVGTDIVSLHRMKDVLGQFDERVINRLFTKTEQVHVYKQKCETAQLGSFAKRFAAKEAAAKALGTGIGQVSFQEIEVSNLPSGAPVLTLHGAALDLLQQKIPAGQTAKLHLSLTDEKLHAMAFVVIEAVCL